jgi:hypothetical protein
MGAAAHVHKKLKSPADFDAGPTIWVNTLTGDTGDQPPGRDLPEELEPELDPVRDRVLSTRVQSFSSIVHRFTYEATGTTGFIEVAGSPPSVSRSSNWRPLRIRQVAVAATVGLVGMGSLMLASAYDARHAWFATYGHGRLIALVGIALGALLAAVLARLLLPRRLWASAAVKVPLGLTGVAALGLALAWKYPGPSTAVAKRALEGHDFDRAEVEANALGELHIDPRGAAEVLDGLHLERLKKCRTFEDLAAAVRQSWNLDENRQIGLRILHEIGDQKKAEFYGAKNVQGLASIGASIGDLDPTLRDVVAAHTVLVQAAECVTQNDCACVMARLKSIAEVEATAAEAKRIHDIAATTFAATLKDLVSPASLAPARDPHDKQRSLKQALDLARCYGDLAGAPSDPAPPAIEALLVPVNQEVEIANKKAAALAAIEEAKRKQQEAIAEARRKQEEAAAAARAAAEERAQRAASRSLVCRDGSTSGCSCAGSHRGCCSHHGGVAGCEPL